MLSMCRLFDGMILLLLILSCVDHWMGLMFISLLFVMCTSEVHFILPLLLSYFVGFFKIWPFLVSLVGWLIFLFLIGWLVLPFMVGLFYSTTFNRYFVYMSIVYFVYYRLVQNFIFYFLFLFFWWVLRLCLGSLLVFWVWSFCFMSFLFLWVFSFCLMSWLLIWFYSLFMVHLPKSHLWGSILKRQRWWIQLQLWKKVISRDDHRKVILWAYRSQIL